MKDLLITAGTDVGSLDRSSVEEELPVNLQDVGKKADGNLFKQL